MEVAAGDALKPETLSKALQGVDCAYYLIHSMAGPSGFEKLDLQAARNFGIAAKKAGVNRIIYLGGIGDPQADLSPHLRSRQETGQALRKSGVPVTEFRAAVIVGSGSISFEMIRHLVERLPIMVCPKWIYSRIQPIAINDLLEYLVSAINEPKNVDRTIEIGGADVTTYRGPMLGYARARGLRRLLILIPIPVLSPRLSSYWVHWMTPIPAKITSALVEGLRNDVVVTNNLSKTLFPNVTPLDYSSAIGDVIQDLDQGRIDTSWSDSANVSDDSEGLVRLESRQGVIIERRRHKVSAAPADVYRVLAGIGGARGWFLRQLDLATARNGRPLARRWGPPKRPPPPGRPSRRRRRRLLARGSLGRKPAHPLEGRDEAAGPRLAPVRNPGPPRRHVPLEQTAAFIPKGLPGLSTGPPCTPSMPGSSAA